ncbi:transcriptional regulator [Nonomuraea maritima]|uniref:transcriptional regulator n=1 Tax=Nonomuraea maritima TaxID=683260 RepID=UPI0037161D9A
MGYWEVSADTLARGRFTVSALAETIAATILLTDGRPAHPGERAWLDEHRPAYRRRLADDPVLGLLVRAASATHWIPDFLTPAPPAAETTFDDELAVIRDTPPAAAQADLAVALGGPPPSALDRPDLPVRAAELVEWVWRETVQPTWPRRRRIIEADIVSRTERLSRSGWAAALTDLRPGMHWLGDGRLQINAHNYPPRRLDGAELLFVPVVPDRAWVAWRLPDRYALIYPCSGQLLSERRAPAALARLLGAGRANVLVLLDSPRTTTQLVALTGQGLGSVGRHLQVLLDARLVRRRRSGRSVLYWRTATGDALVADQDSGHSGQ